jgi:tetratricopeptide (TPR) repeat protein
MDSCAAIRLSVLALVVSALALPALPLLAAENAAEDDAAKTDKLIEQMQTRLMELQSQEMQLNMKIMEMRGKAEAGLENPGKAAEELAKGGKSRGLSEYKAILMSCAQQLQGFSGRMAPIMKMVKTLERDREGAPDDLKGRIDQVVLQANGKYRATLESVANLYEQAAEFKPALGLYLQVLKSVPEDKLKEEKDLQERVADLYDKCGDTRNALVIYKSLMDAKPEKDRFKDRKLGEKAAKAYEKAGDYKTAIAYYRAMHDALPKDKQEKDGKGLRDRIAECEKKTGRPSR